MHSCKGMGRKQITFRGTGLGVSFQGFFLSMSQQDDLLNGNGAGDDFPLLPNLSLCCLAMDPKP